MVSKGQFVGLAWNRIMQLHSQVMTGTKEIHFRHRSVSLRHIKMQHPTRSRRVVGSNPIWDSLHLIFLLLR